MIMIVEACPEVCSHQLQKAACQKRGKQAIKPLEA